MSDAQWFIVAAITWFVVATPTAMLVGAVLRRMRETTDDRVDR